MAFADTVADAFVAGKDPATDDKPSADSPGQMLITAVKANDPAGVEAAVRACMESTSY